MNDAEVIDDLRLALDWYMSVVPPPPDRPYGPPLDRSAIASGLAAIDVALRPMVLPAEVRWMWETWDAGSFDIIPMARMTLPDFALDSWQEGVIEYGDDPWALFPIGYQSHSFLLVELGTPTPAPLWTSFFGFPDFSCVFPSLAAMFRSCAEITEAAGAASSTGHRYDELASLWDGWPSPPSFARIVDRHFAASQTSERRDVPWQVPEAWPMTWRRPLDAG